MNMQKYIIAALFLSLAATTIGCEYATYEPIPYKGSSADETLVEPTQIEAGDEGRDDLLKKIEELQGEIEALNQEIANQGTKQSPSETDPTPSPTPDPTPIEESTDNSNDPRCGDGRLDNGELCDDGNDTVWDGCTFCKVDADSVCDQGSPSVCSDKFKEMI